MGIHLVSVLLPAYNAEAYIAQSIQSILNQTYNNLELIVINDGSTDGTEKIIASFKDSRIVLINNKENEGLVAVLNKGIAHCKGEFIARMDADDWAYPTRISKQLSYLLKNKLVGICGCNIELWDGNQILDRWLFPTMDEEIKASLLFKCSFAHPTVMYRKSLFSDYNEVYEKDFFPAEDYKLWVRLSKKTEFHNINQILLRYRITPNQISSCNQVAQQAKAIEISWNQVLKMFKDKEPSPKQYEVHKLLIQDNWPKNKHDLIELSSWINVLHRTNKLSKDYNEKILGNILAKKLWDICYFLITENIESFLIYKKSLVKDFYNPPYNKLIKAHLKTFFYKYI